MKIRNLIKDITPPLLWRIGSKLRRFSTSQDDGSDWKYGAEQPPEFYDEKFHKADHWRQHYTESRYYPLWAVIADRVLNAGVESILDIGCGPGQFAHLLHDKGISKYCGIDFSTARIKQARRVCPEYNFLIEDIFNTKAIENREYECVIATEFLEHIERDLRVVERIRNGSMLFATVPNFAYAGHVRHFSSASEVRDRYAQHVRQIRVDVHFANASGKKYYLIEAQC